MSTAMAPAANGNGGQMTLKQHLQSPAMIAELGKAMPAHCKPERMARIAITALTRTPKLADCTPASFFECLLSLSQWGLEPDGRRAHLIPYGNKCTLIIDYKGYVELAYRSGVVRNIHADVVHEGDDFEYSTGRVEKHVPWFLRRDEAKPAAEGKIYAVYCQVELTGGTVKTEVLSYSEVEAIRKRSRAGNSGPWQTDWGEMAKKTAFRRVSKWLPLSAEIRDAFDRDEDVIEGTATPARSASTVSELSRIFAADSSSSDADQGGNNDPMTIDAPPTSILDRAEREFAACQSVDLVDETEAALKQLDITEGQEVDISQMADAARKRLVKGSKQKSLV